MRECKSEYGCSKVLTGLSGLPLREEGLAGEIVEPEEEKRK